MTNNVTKNNQTKCPNCKNLSKHNKKLNCNISYRYMREFDDTECFCNLCKFKWYKKGSD
jgi:hypothetical protein